VFFCGRFKQTFESPSDRRFGRLSGFHIEGRNNRPEASYRWTDRAAPLVGSAEPRSAPRNLRLLRRASFPLYAPGASGIIAVGYSVPGLAKLLSEPLGERTGRVLGALAAGAAKYRTNEPHF